MHSSVGNIGVPLFQFVSGPPNHEPRFTHMLAPDLRVCRLPRDARFGDLVLRLSRWCG